MKTVFIVFLLVALSFGQQPPEQTSKTPAPADPAEHAWEIINNAFKDSNPDKRREVVMAASLGEPDNRIFAFLTAPTRDHDVQVRLATCATLAALRDKRALPLLRGMLDDVAPEVTFCAAQGLWQLGDQEGREILLSVLEGEVKTRSSYLTIQKRDTLRMLRTPGPLFVNIVKLGIGFAPVPGLGTGLTSVQSMEKNTQITGRALSALALAQDKSPETLRALVDALDDKEWSVRAAAVQALAVRNQPRVSGVLVPLLDDKKDAVRYRAAFAYLRLSKEGKRKFHPVKAAAQ